jgi:hypothetical protein
MIECGAASEDEMIAAFLRAEIDSSRYGNDFVKTGLTQRGLERSIIDTPNCADAPENAIRRDLMQYRGYKTRQALFAGFPSDVRWRRVELEARDFAAMRYINDALTETPHWTSLSGGTRLVSVGARNFRQRQTDPTNHQIAAIAQELRNGRRFPELIAAEAEDGSLILVEGHSRATAYAIEEPVHSVEALVGSSPSMAKWVFY